MIEEENETPMPQHADNEMDCFIDPPTVPRFEEDDGDPVAEPMEDPLIAKLREVYTAYITPRFTVAGVPADMIEPYVEEKIRWFAIGVAKFADGQIKHGGDIRERDMDVDEEQEVMDLTEYKITRRLQRKYLRIYVPN